MSEVSQPKPDTAAATLSDSVGSETILGIKCPFCVQPLKMESYRMRKGYAPTCIVFCDHEACEIKPSTIDTSPSKAFADVKAWGNWTKEVSHDKT
jgi:hypothetical protein